MSSHIGIKFFNVIKKYFKYITIKHYGIEGFHLSLDCVLQSVLQDTHVSFKTVNRIRISYLKSDTLPCFLLTGMEYRNCCLIYYLSCLVFHHYNIKLEREILFQLRLELQ